MSLTSGKVRTDGHATGAGRPSASPEAGAPRRYVACVTLQIEVLERQQQELSALCARHGGAALLPLLTTVSHLAAAVEKASTQV